MKYLTIRSAWTWLIPALCLAGIAHAQDERLQPSARLAAPSLVITDQTRIADIRALPDNATVRTRSGRVVRAHALKQLVDSIKLVQQQRTAPPVRTLPTLSRVAPAAPVQVQVKRGTDLRALAARPDSDVLQLPNGQKLTIGDFKKLDNIERMRSGRSLVERQAALSRPAVPAGPAIKIASNADLAALASHPDSTVVQNPAGRRITLGELRAYAQRSGRKIGG